MLESLFGRWRVARRAREIERVLKLEASACAVELERKWVEFRALARALDLVKAIDAFAKPAQIYVEQHRPMILSQGGTLFWVVLFTAIQQSGTERQEDLNAAIAELEKVHASRA